jgi:4-carboxymuconolactone decarboxylase
MGKADFDKGMKTRRATLGDEWVDRAISTQTPFNAEFQDMITRTCWDEIWNRPGLSRRERRMLVIAQTAAMGRWEEFKLHAGAALRSGDLSADDLKEMLLQTSVYCGVPTANTAFREARELVTATAALPQGGGRKGKR